MIRSQIAQITIHQLGIPFRRPFGHGAAVREASDNVVLAVELDGGTTGFGETLARPYVTGETPAGVVEAVQREFVPRLLEAHPQSFGEAIEFLDSLPLTIGGRPMYAARCAVELALLDAWGRLFRRSPEALAGWLDQPFWSPPGATAKVGYSGIIGFSAPEKASRMALLMRLWGLRDIKVKVGDAREFERLEAVVRRLGGALRAGRARLRVDANGSWRPEELDEKVGRLEELGVLYLEQPTAKDADGSWLEVQHHRGVNLIADESLVSPEDGERLADDYRAGVFDIRIAKNGGLLPSLRLAGYAYSRGIEVQLGCLVGETMILTRAGQWFAALLPEVIFAEGNYGRWLMKDDVARREPLRYRGRIPAPGGPGLGVQVDAGKLQRYAHSAAIPIKF